MTIRRIGAITVTCVEEALRPGFEPQQLLPDWDKEVLAEHGDWVRRNGKAFRFEFDHGDKT